MRAFYLDITIPESKKTTGQICDITDLTGINSGMDSYIHKGFTVGKGKTLYWYIIWHPSGNCTVCNPDDMKPRWLPGNTIITVHFK